MNDGIPKPPFTVQHVSVNAVIKGIMAQGRGTLMAKFDVASVHHNVAIHPDDRPLLGMQWGGKYISRYGSPIWVAFSAVYFLLRTWLNGSWFIIVAWTSYATTWMTFLPLVRCYPRSATPIYLPVLAFAKGLDSSS